MKLQLLAALLAAGFFASCNGSGEQKADSALRLLRAQQPGAYVVKSKIYMGCMH
ncbi:hypothetical protein [Flaviaesturariibacter flavus]|uniref:hypothetical protein n=1 Tax=Flaviaesturariibacter flavus TaxID=2502780 RepID=UPI0014044748|nr:hypothetical protein [Flaviaesturariibacter flavus]